MSCESCMQTQKAQKWQGLDEATTSQIRNGLLNTLASPVSISTPDHCIVHDVMTSM